MCGGGALGPYWILHPRPASNRRSALGHNGPTTDSSVEASLSVGLVHRPSAAAYVFQLCHRQHHRIERAQSVEIEVYDEARLPLIVHEPRLADAHVRTAANREIVPVAMKRRVSALNTTKLFQAQTKWGGLVAKRMPSGERRYVACLGRVANHAAAIPSTSALAQAASLLEANSSSMIEAHFEHNTRVAQADQHSANRLTEKYLRRLRSYSVDVLEISCRAHIHANVHADAVRPLIATNSGIVNTTLSFNVAGSMGDFKACMYDQIRQRLQIRVGDAGLEAEIYRMTALRLFLPRGCRLAERRAILAMLPNGRWANHNAVEVWVPEDKAEALNVDALAADVVEGMMAVLVCRRIRFYNAGRWLDQEQSVCDLSTLEVVHGLLTPAYEEFCRKATAAARERNTRRDHAVACAGGLDALALGDGDDGAEHVVVEGVVDGAEPAVGADAAKPVDASSYAERNAAHRTTRLTVDPL